mgnify:CR=1 FL=1
MPNFFALIHAKPELGYARMQIKNGMIIFAMFEIEIENCPCHMGYIYMFPAFAKALAAAE